VKTILIVEDNELIRDLFRDLLQTTGYKVIESVDGSDTLQVARKYLPDLILMDHLLPEVTGIEHTKMLKADDELKHIPVIAVTADASPSVEKQFLEVGCDGFISKPIDVPNFLETVAYHIT